MSRSGETRNESRSISGFAIRVKPQNPQKSA
jgi:hypothetical protein